MYKYFWEAKGKDWKYIYFNNESKVSSVFTLIELLPLVELVHHFLDFYKIKQHTFIHMLINIWIVFGVIEFCPAVI